MDWTTIGTQVFNICIVPILGLLTGYLVMFLREKIDASIKKTNSELAAKYLEMLKETITNCVLATKQTYVDSLKDKNVFDESAQKEAFAKVYDTVMGGLTDEMKNYLGHVTTDLPTLVAELIEAKVAETK